MKISQKTYYKLIDFCTKHGSLAKVPQMYAELKEIIEENKPGVIDFESEEFEKACDQADDFCKNN